MLGGVLALALVAVVVSAFDRDDGTRLVLDLVAAIAIGSAAVMSYRRIRALGLSLDETTRQLLALGAMDDVTGLATRSSFERAIEGEVARAKRTQGQFTVLRADLRGLATLAPAAAEQALRWFAGVISHQTRAIDTRARLGAETFAVILVGADSHTATAVVERIQAQTAPAGVRLAFGVATYPQDGEETQPLLRRAEEELAVTS